MAVYDAAPAKTLAESLSAAIIEGCVGETLAAARAEAALSETRCPTARALLAQIAQDEASHAELAWRFVAWALKQDASLQAHVRAAFDEALRRLTLAGPGAETHHSAKDWERMRAFGRLSATEDRALALRVAEEVIAPCVAALLEVRDHASPQPASALGVTLC
jgi:hypothetical protein